MNSTEPRTAHLRDVWPRRISKLPASFPRPCPSRVVNPRYSLFIFRVSAVKTRPLLLGYGHPRSSSSSQSTTINLQATVNHLPSLRPCSGPPLCSVFTVASSFAVVASNPVMAFFPETSIGVTLQSRLCLPRRALLRDGLKPHVIVSPALAVVGSKLAVSSSSGSAWRRKLVSSNGEFLLICKTGPRSLDYSRIRPKLLKCAL
ncbi:hypothetical protein Bca52824_082717 [Brassica carinata]|uniref:Uncharacterized protein n=2 Tax=Brassica carinata TaxID=52824 RepID=A0A8X7PIP6_BRACI|nr:hypothetical protein Bca52824_082717 [Brassica carinata]